MGKTFHLTKVIIRNFRSIKVAHINNIGDITVFVGANESGKSNILKALNWFGTDKPLEKDDIPVEFWGKENKEYLKSPIVEAYFEIVDREKFKERIIFSITEILDTIEMDINGDTFKNAEDILNKTQFLKFEKYADGLFKAYIYDNQLENITEEFDNWFKSVIPQRTPLDLFDKIFESILKKELEKFNIPETQIANAITNVKSNANFNNHYRRIVEEINRLNTFEKFDGICKQIKNIVKNIPNTTVSIPIPGRTISLNPYNVFTKTIAKFASMFSNIFINLKPKFIYLDEEMELKGVVVKNISWSNTLREDNRDYPINARLLSILGIDLEEFDKKPEEEQDLILENKAHEFSKLLRNSWKKNIGLKMNLISGYKISFKIIEYDNDKEPIKTTYPEYRSKGFKWYLAYLITLNYLIILKKKNDRDIVLLLDDPAVYLHPNAQKRFLNEIEKLSKEYQILYNTHLISLFNEEELDRVLLVYLDKENRTKIKKPWSNKQKDIIYPIRKALGFDKILFEENLKNVLFVEGISDKFILEGLRKLKSFMKLEDWYIHPLSGGDYVENNDIVKKILLYGYLSNLEEINYYFLLDGDKEHTKNTEKIDDKIKERIIFLGNESQEIEDLIDRDFYLECVLDTYRRIFTHDPEKFKKVKEIVEELKNQDYKIIKELNNKFKSNNLGDFSKVDVAITIKRKLYENPNLADKFDEVKKCLKDKIL